MAQISMTILAKDPEDFHHTMRELSDTTLKIADYNVDRKSFSPAELDKLIADKVQNAYQQGVRDGKSEAQSETLHSKERTMALMMGHSLAMVTLQAGVAPFKFRPIFMCQYEQLSVHRKELLQGNDFQAPQEHAVGIYGWSYVSAKHMFITKIDHWTLAAPDAKA